MKVLLDKSHVLVQLNEEQSTVEVIWKKFAMSPQYREAIRIAQEAIINYKLDNWLSDMTNAGVVALEDQHWMKEQMIPKGAQAGIAKVAIVMAKDIFSKKYIDSIETDLQNFTTRHFDDIESARNWLGQDQSHP